MNSSPIHPHIAQIPNGFQFSGVRCGLKNKRNDLGLLVSDRPAKIAGVFTQNQVRAACVEQSKEVVSGGIGLAVVVNSGNANCCTGAQGRRDALAMAKLAADALKIDSQYVASASTGIIGQLLDMSKIESGIASAATLLSSDPRPFMDAILTTDLVEKVAVASVKGVKVFGVAKGSGMMAPNMATMLAFIVTDADATDLDLQAICKDSADRGFNRCTVDGDTSTNDMYLLMANGSSGLKLTHDELLGAVTEVCDSLARQIAKDGEGATKLLEIIVKGTEDPKKIAKSIAESPLVKTAMFGCDPNWGRMMMAAGKAGVPFDPSQVILSVTTAGETHILFDRGGPAPFDPQRVSSGLKSDHVIIEFKVESNDNFAENEAVLYTCDLGYGYVRINAEYHT